MDYVEKAENGASTEELEEIISPLEVIEEVGFPYSVVITVGGPYIRLSAEGNETVVLQGYWGLEECKMYDPAFDKFFEYFIDRNK